jgi:hypothetical protein
MIILRRKLFRLWMLCSILWLAFGLLLLVDDQRPNIFFLSPPIMLFLAGLGLSWIWERFGEPHWLRLPEHFRRGLLRAYLVIAVPWVAWYGYQIYDFVQGHHYWHWRDISHSFWSLLIVPIGGPVCLLALFWVLSGFRKPVPGTNGALTRDGQSQASGPSPEAEAIYRRLDRLMTDEKAQIDGLPEPFRSEVLSGIDCDEITGATGEFGRDPRNPIPVNGPLGEMIYLSNLRTATSQQIMFHRLGSFAKIDAYETASLDGTAWDVFFLDLYHPRKSRRAPTGYRIAADAEREKLFFGANEFVASFPDQLPNAISNTNERLIGGRMRPRQIREAVEQINFVRPAGHLTRLNSVMAMLEAKADPRGL